VRIDGRFRGEISSENTLIVGESGEIEAKIRSRTVAVSGSVLGDVSATTKVVVHKTGRIEGNIETESLVIEEGAVINGVIKMGKAAGKMKAIDGGARKPEMAPPVKS
jgi:cytoskeletal protein CcmA (bactofilin family)